MRSRRVRTKVDYSKLAGEPADGAGGEEEAEELPVEEPSGCLPTTMLLPFKYQAAGPGRNAAASCKRGGNAFSLPRPAEAQAPQYDFRVQLHTLATRKGFDARPIAVITPEKCLPSPQIELFEPLLVQQEGEGPGEHSHLHAGALLSAQDVIRSLMQQGREVQTLNVAKQEPGPKLFPQQWQLYFAARLQRGNADNAALAEAQRHNRLHVGQPGYGGVTSEHVDKLLSMLPQSLQGTGLQAGSHSLPHPVKGLSSLPSSYGHAVKAVLSPAGAYVDFHMPLDGEANWWHIVEGVQAIALIPPTPGNLSSYAAWLSKAKGEMCFLAANCKGAIATHVIMHMGETLLIPVGWAYAIGTLEHSTVLTGSWTCTKNLEPQLAMHELSVKVEQPRAAVQEEHFQERMLQAAKGYVGDLMRKSGMDMEQMQLKVKADRERTQQAQLAAQQAHARAQQLAQQVRAAAGAMAMPGQMGNMNMMQQQHLQLAAMQQAAHQAAHAQPSAPAVAAPVASGAPAQMPPSSGAPRPGQPQMPGSSAPAASMGMSGGMGMPMQGYGGQGNMYGGMAQPVMPPLPQPLPMFELSEVEQRDIVALLSHLERLSSVPAAPAGEGAADQKVADRAAQAKTMLDQLRACVEACGLGALFRETGKELITPRPPTRKFKTVHDERLLRQLLVSAAPINQGEAWFPERYHHQMLDDEEEAETDPDEFDDRDSDSDEEAEDPSDYSASASEDEPRAGSKRKGGPKKATAPKEEEEEEAEGEEEVGGDEGPNAQERVLKKLKIPK